MNTAPPARKRRRILRSVTALAVAGVGLVALPFLHVAPAHPYIPSKRMRAAYLSQHAGALLHHTGMLDEVLHDVATSGYNEVYLNVYGLGGPFFPSRHSPSVPVYVIPGTDPLRAAIRQARRQGLKVGAWVEYGLMLQPDSPVARLHPDWLLRLPNGQPVVEGRVWLNPVHPGVRRLMLGLMEELAGYKELSIIQLDDHWGIPAAFGNHRAALTSLTRAAFRTVKRVDPHKVLSLSPNNYRHARARYNQDWLPWVQEGIIEEVMLQAYRKSEREVAAEIDASGLALAARRARTGVIIFAGAELQPFTRLPHCDR